MHKNYINYGKIKNCWPRSRQIYGVKAGQGEGGGEGEEQEGGERKFPNIQNKQVIENSLHSILITNKHFGKSHIETVG